MEEKTLFQSSRYKNLERCIWPFSSLAVVDVDVRCLTGSKWTCKPSKHAALTLGVLVVKPLEEERPHAARLSRLDYLDSSLFSAGYKKRVERRDLFEFPSQSTTYLGLAFDLSAKKVERKQSGRSYRAIFSDISSRTTLSKLLIWCAMFILPAALLKVCSFRFLKQKTFFPPRHKFVERGSRVTNNVKRKTKYAYTPLQL